MNKQEITSYLTDTYDASVQTKESKFFKEAFQHALIALDVKTVAEILSNFNLTGLDNVVKETHRHVAAEYRNAFEQKTQKA